MFANAPRWRRWLNLDRLATRFNRWFGPAAIAANTGPLTSRDSPNPSAIVGALGELEPRANDSSQHVSDEELPPIHLDSASPGERDKGDD
jgi:hypothetical protein